MTNLQIKRVIEKIKAGDLLEATYNIRALGQQQHAIQEIFLVMKKPYLIKDPINNKDIVDYVIQTAIDVYVMNSTGYCFRQIMFKNVKALSREKLQHYTNYSLRIVCSSCNKHTSKKITFKKGLRGIQHNDHNGD